jgi:CRP-like cAMP-binding protein
MRRRRSNVPTQSRVAVRPPRRGQAASKIDYLAATDIFRDLSPEQMADIDRMTAVTTCRRGRVFYTPGETGEVLFILKRGRVNIYRLSPEGHKLITATLGPGTVFGEMSLIGQGMRGSFAEAAEDCTLCVMGRADLEHVLTDSPRVALRLIEVLSARLEGAEQQLETLAFKSVPARVAAALLHLAGADDVVTGVTHQDLAEMVGIHRETATRTLNELRARGLIDLGRARVRILDADGLRALVE